MVGHGQNAAAGLIDRDIGPAAGEFADKTIAVSFLAETHAIGAAPFADFGQIAVATLRHGDTIALPLLHQGGDIIATVLKAGENIGRPVLPNLQEIAGSRLADGKIRTANGIGSTALGDGHDVSLSALPGSDPVEIARLGQVEGIGLTRLEDRETVAIPLLADGGTVSAGGGQRHDEPQKEHRQEDNPESRTTINGSEKHRQIPVQVAVTGRGDNIPPAI